MTGRCKITNIRVPMHTEDEAALKKMADYRAEAIFRFDRELTMEDHARGRFGGSHTDQPRVRSLRAHELALALGPPGKQFAPGAAQTNLA